MAKRLDLCIDGKGHISFIDCEGIGRCVKCHREVNYYERYKNWERKFAAKMVKGGRKSAESRSLKLEEVF